MVLSGFGVVTLCFALVHLVPGDPVDIILGEQAAAEDKAGLRAELGLDQPLAAQFVTYLKQLTHLDLGLSLRTRLPVAEELGEHVPATMELALTALAFALLWALPVGVLSAIQRGGWIDRAASALALLGMSVPGVFLGPMLIYIFAIELEWFPISDRGGLEHLMLPALSLALPLGAVIVKMTRASLLTVLNEDYMRTARAKGLGPFGIYAHHGLRNALIPIVTIVGLQLSGLLTGTVITETIFDWPGVGELLYGAIQARDYTLVQGSVLFISVIYLSVNALTDLVYAAVNPRLRLGDAE